MSTRERNTGSPGRRVWAVCVCAIGTLSLGCSESPVVDPAGTTSPQHLITREHGRDMVGAFSRSSRVRLSGALALETRYAAAAFRQVIHQPGARTVTAALGQNEDGTTTLMVRAVDEFDRQLPQGLANGQLVAASEMEHLVGRVHADDGAARALVTATNAIPIRRWMYSAASLQRVAGQSNVSTMRLALGENAGGEPTVVFFAEDQEEEYLPMAGDNGVPSPPY